MRRSDELLLTAIKWSGFVFGWILCAMLLFWLGYGILASVNII